MKSWPAHLEGACYTREDGWFHAVREPSGKIRRAPIPAHVIAEACLDEHPELRDGITTLVLRSQPLQNLIPRRTP